MDISGDFLARRFLDGDSRTVLLVNNRIVLLVNMCHYRVQCIRGSGGICHTSIRLTII